MNVQYSGYICGSKWPIIYNTLDNGTDCLQAKGNTVLALILTCGSNLLGSNDHPSFRVLSIAMPYHCRTSVSVVTFECGSDWCVLELCTKHNFSDHPGLVDCITLPSLYG